MESQLKTFLRLTEMDLLIEKLEKFGLKNFINVHRHNLCNITVNQQKISAVLRFDADQIAIINAPPDNFSKNARLYELIQKIVEVRNFIEALDETGNEHILKFIKETAFSTGVTGTRTVAAGGNPSGSALSSPSSSSSSSCSTGRLKAELVAQHLKGVDLGTFLKGNLVFLCRRTKNLSIFVICLIEQGLVTEEEADACSLLSGVEQCKKLYLEAGKTGWGDKLVQALQSSENEHIIEEMHKWISQ